MCGFGRNTYYSKENANIRPYLLSFDSLANMQHTCKYVAYLQIPKNQFDIFQEVDNIYCNMF